MASKPAASSGPVRPTRAIGTRLQRLSCPSPRPWPMLPAEVQLQLAWQVAHLLRRMHQERRRAERS